MIPKLSKLLTYLLGISLLLFYQVDDILMVISGKKVAKHGPLIVCQVNLAYSTVTLRTTLSYPRIKGERVRLPFRSLHCRVREQQADVRT